jgi:glycosyltransferase involved in cell wall biosynthesis
LTDDARPVVLTIAGHYLPGFRAGGPIRSLANLVDALGEELSFRVVAYDRDLGTTAPYPGLRDEWMRVGVAEVRYLPPGAGLVRTLARLLRHERYDVLYLQTFFDPRLALFPLLLRRLGLIPRVPVVIAPRGQFSPGAFALGAWKKRAYTALVRRLLRGDETWQATAAIEVEDITRRLGDVRIRVAPNVPPVPLPVSARTPKTPGTLRAVFLSRVSRKKNLLGAVRAFEGVRGDLQLDVYGPLEDAHYWAECERAAAALSGDGLRLVHRGEVEPANVAETFAAHDLFLFPTLGENFGHVILEALLAGCPCLISDQTPWRGLEAARAGWDLPLARMSAFSEALQWCADAGAAEMAELSLGARALAVDYLRGDQSVDASRSLLLPSAAT